MLRPISRPNSVYLMTTSFITSIPSCLLVPIQPPWPSRGRCSCWCDTLRSKINCVRSCEGWLAQKTLVMRHSWYTIKNLPFCRYLTKSLVSRESLRIVPPDVLPVLNGEGIPIRKGTIVHVPIEAINLDREIWGQDGWEFV